jgi:RNA polymerase sigma-70 factor (ECF subfamily)
MISGQAQQEDLAQDIFIRVYESLRQFQFHCSLATWISRIAYNMCLNHFRRSKSHPQDNPDYRTGLEGLDDIEQTDRANMIALDSQTPHAVIYHRELATAVAEAIERLPSHYRLVIALYYIEGFALPDLAESLCMPIGTIKSHLFRARAMLKADLLQKFTIEDLIR